MHSKKQKHLGVSYVFDEPKAIRINKARLRHLESLKLDFDGEKIIDIGCGVGYLAQFFLKKKCHVFCIDGRKENISNLRLRYPGLKSRVVDVEKEDLSKLGHFDVAFCYGLLYHTKNPNFVLKNICGVRPDLILLETCITDSPNYEVKLVDDTPAANQALHGIGCRPSPRFVVSHLRANGYSYVYVPRKTPKHQDFKFEYKGDGSILSDGHLIRQIFIASTNKLNNPNLIPISDGHEFHHKDALLRLPYFLLKLLAQVLYRPRSFSSPARWQVGSTENGLDRYRSFLKRLWDALEIKNEKTTKLILCWYNKIKLTIHLDNETSRCVYVEGLYEPAYFYFLSKFIKKGMNFIDVGANIGLFSLFAASLVGKNGRVFAFEPSKRDYNRLLQNTNRFGAIIKTFRYAIADRNGWAKLKIADNFHSGHNSLGHFVYKTVKPIREEKVRVVTFGRFAQENNLKRIDVIKIDVEGFEYQVLKSAQAPIKKFLPVILIEISNRRSLVLLKSFGYHCYFFEDTGNLKEISQMKNVSETLNVVAFHNTLENFSLK